MDARFLQRTVACGATVGLGARLNLTVFGLHNPVIAERLTFLLFAA